MVAPVLVGGAKILAEELLGEVGTEALMDMLGIDPTEGETVRRAVEDPTSAEAKYLASKRAESSEGGVGPEGVLLAAAGTNKFPKGTAKYNFQKTVDDALNQVNMMEDLAYYSDPKDFAAKADEIAQRVVAENDTPQAYEQIKKLVVEKMKFNKTVDEYYKTVSETPIPDKGFGGKEGSANALLREEAIKIEKKLESDMKRQHKKIKKMMGGIGVEIDDTIEESLGQVEKFIDPTFQEEVNARQSTIADKTSKVPTVVESEDIDAAFRDVSEEARNKRTMDKLRTQEKIKENLDKWAMYEPDTSKENIRKVAKEAYKTDKPDGVIRKIWKGTPFWAKAVGAVGTGIAAKSAFNEGDDLDELDADDKALLDSFNKQQEDKEAKKGPTRDEILRKIQIQQQIIRDNQ